MGQGQLRKDVPNTEGFNCTINSLPPLKRLSAPSVTSGRQSKPKAKATLPLGNELEKEAKENAWKTGGGILAWGQECLRYDTLNASSAGAHIWPTSY